MPARKDWTPILRLHGAWFAGAILILFAANWAFYQPFPYRSLMGDDLANLTTIDAGQGASNFHQMFLEAFSTKYRPLFQAAIGSLFHLFRYDIGAYIALNTVLQAANSIVFFAAARELTNGRNAIALLAAIAFSVNRFGYYQIWQVTGLLEGEATFFFLMVLFSYVRACRTQNLNWLYIGLGAAVAACFTHERYLAALPALALAGLFWPSANVTRAQRWLLVGLPIGIGVLNIAIKKLLTNSDVMVGTGGTNLDFVPGRIAAFMGAGSANVFGFNVGPTYLSGQALSEAPLWIIVLSGLIALLSVVALAPAVVGQVKAAKRDWRAFGLLATFLAAFVLLLLAGSITIRQEFRWLLAPYVVVLLALCAGAAMLPRAVGPIVMTAFALLCAVHGLHYRTAVQQNVFFMQGLREADNAYHMVTARSSPPTSVTIVAQSEQAECGWYFLGKAWAKVYMKAAQHFDCIVGLDDVPSEAAAGGALVLSSTGGGQLSEVTEQVRQLVADRGREQTVAIDLYEKFGAAKLNSNAPVDTPSKRGAFASEGWQSVVGPVNSIVVVSTFSVSYALADIKDDSSKLVLKFGAGRAYDSPGQAFGFADLARPGQAPKRLWRAELPLPKEGAVAPLPVRVLLSKRELQGATLTLGVESPQGMGNALWGVFTTPSIVVETEHRE